MPRSTKYQKTQFFEQGRRRSPQKPYLTLEALLTKGYFRAEAVV
jgi:hypothetical protein